MHNIACVVLTALFVASGALAQGQQDGSIAAANAAVVEAYRAGRYDVALDLAKEALTRAEEVLGPEHPQTLSSVNNVALLYQTTGRTGEAEPLFRRAIEARERVMGPEHPKTLSSVNNLAALYVITGRTGEAEPLYRRALEARERVLGPDHQKTLISVNNLAYVYQTTGRYAEAEPLYRRALEAREQVQGPEHPDTIVSVNNLAGLYEATGRYGEAEPLFRRALEASERVLGPEHPDTLISVNNLAALYDNTGRTGEAEPLSRRALEVRERVLGPEHPDTLISLNNLAFLLKSTGRYAEAEPLYHRALEARERVLGPEHPQTLASVNNLAALYRVTNRHGEAEPLYRRALEASERVLGPEHPDTLINLNNLAFLYQAVGRYGEAEPLYRRALEAGERVLGPEHPDTIGTIGNLAGLQERTGQMAVALHSLRVIDQRLATWLATEVTTARAAAMRREMLRLNSAYQDISYSFALVHSSPAANRFAADLALRWKKRLAQDDAILNNIARETDDSALRGLIGEVRTGRRALSNVAFDARVPAAEKTRLRLALETSEAALRAASGKFRRFQAPANASADQVMLELPGGSALVEYRLYDRYDFETAEFGETRLLAAVLRPEADVALVDLNVSDHLFDLQALIVDAGYRDERDFTFDALMRRAHGRLIAPLLPHLEGAETFFVSPDGPLNALPFEAFLDESGLRLIERFEVRTIQTGRDLVTRDRPAAGKGLVALGGVDFGETRAFAQAAPEQTDSVTRAALDATRQQFNAFDPLPGSASEVAYIGQAYADFHRDEPAPIVLTGLEASEAAVKALARPPRVLHFATHGYYLKSGSIAGRPLLQSGITLAGANRALSGGVGEDGENGILHAVEVQTLNLFGTELVVLSACDTGQGAHDYSEGLEGLPRAFYVAGAQNVLAALWPVGDRAAANFMARFYDTWLAQTVSDPAAALRTTKLWYLQQTDPTIADPQNWAPFVLFEG